MQFDSFERQYLLEHFRVQHNLCKRSSRPGAAEVAETWDKLRQLLIAAK
jgi:hypothetical protein